MRVVMPKEEFVVIVADPTDDKFLDAAVEGKVDFIVSGDGHLLALGSFQNIPIVSSQYFGDSYTVPKV